MSMECRRRLATLAQTLHGERRLLERLLFKLVEERLVLAADEARLLPFAIAEVEEVVEGVRFGESHRRRAVREFAHAIGETEESITLSFLVGLAPEPYRTMFAEHRDHFQRLTSEIEQVSMHNRRPANPAVQNLGDILVSLPGVGESIGTNRVMSRPNGARATVGAATTRIGKAMSRAQADEVDLRSTPSEAADTDIPLAVMELQVHEVAYQAAQAALARSLQPSLAQFLR